MSQSIFASIARSRSSFAARLPAYTHEQPVRHGTQVDVTPTMHTPPRAPGHSKALTMLTRARACESNVPPAQVTAATSPQPVRPEAAALSDATDVALVAILESPLRLGETAAVGFARKEAELRQAMSKLGVLEARVLKSRLANPKPDDPLAASFTRLTGERRTRLINFLADARRREALAKR